MVGLQIKTELGDLDLFLQADDDFYVTRQIFDVNSLQESKADYTKQIQVPATSNNLVILDLAQDLNSAGGAAEQTIPCRVLLNGVTIAASANLLIVSSEISQGVTVLNLVVLYGNFNFFDSILGGTIDQINWADKVINWIPSVLANMSTNTTDIGWFPMDWFARERSVWSQVRIDVRTSGFFVYSKEIIRRICLEAGYDVEYRNVPADFNAHAIVCPVDKFVLGVEVPEDVRSALVEKNLTEGVQLIDGATAVVTFGELVLDPTGMYDLALNLYLSDVAQDVDITVTGVATWTQGNVNNGPSEIRILHNGGVVATETFPGDGTDVNFYISAPITVAVDDTLQVQAFAVARVNSNSTLTIQTGAQFSFVTQGVAADNLVQPENHIPQIERKQFLTSVMGNFNLILQADQITRVVVIQPFNDINNQNQQDWSNNLDVASNTDIDYAYDGYARNSLMKYADDSLVRRRDIPYVAPFSNEILSLDTTIIDLIYAGCDNSPWYKNPSQTIPFAKTSHADTDSDTSNGAIGEPAVIFSGTDIFEMQEGYELDFQVGNYIDFHTGGTAFTAPNFRIRQKDTASSGRIEGTLPLGVDSKAFTIYKWQRINDVPKCVLIKPNQTLESWSPFGIVSGDMYNIADNEVELLPSSYLVAKFPNSMLMNEVARAHYLLTFASVGNAQFLHAWFNFTTTEFSNIDFLSHVYISGFNARYYINKINQFKSGGQTRIDLVRLTDIQDVLPQRYNVADISSLVEGAVVVTNEITIDGGGAIPGPGSADFFPYNTLTYDVALTGNTGYLSVEIKNTSSGNIIASAYSEAAAPTLNLTIVPQDLLSYENGQLTASSFVGLISYSIEDSDASFIWASLNIQETTVNGGLLTAAPGSSAFLPSNTLTYRIAWTGDVEGRELKMEFWNIGGDQFAKYSLGSAETGDGTVTYIPTSQPNYTGGGITVRVTNNKNLSIPDLITI